MRPAWLRLVSHDRARRWALGSDFNVLLKEPVSNMFPQEKEEILSKQGEELSDLQEQLLRARESGKFDKI